MMCPDEWCGGWEKPERETWLGNPRTVVIGFGVATLTRGGGELSERWQQWEEHQPSICSLDPQIRFRLYKAPGGKMPPKLASGSFLTAYTPYRRLAAISIFDHGCKFQTAKGAEGRPLLIERDHRSH